MVVMIALVTENSSGDSVATFDDWGDYSGGGGGDVNINSNGW